MGYVRGLLHGAAIGTVVGICLAPQTGAKTRRQVAAWGRSARQGYEAAERAVHKVSPVVAPLAQRFKHATEDEAMVSVHGTVRIHDEPHNGNGHRN